MKTTNCRKALIKIEPEWANVIEDRLKVNESSIDWN